MPLRLTMGFSDNPRVQPLKDGIVKPQGIELDCITLDPSTLFQRNLTYDEFDVSEMSISETLLARERTDGKKWDWSALPVFLSRGHHWHTLYINTAAGIKSLADVRGKRIGADTYVAQVVKLGASGAELDTDCPLAMFDAVQVILPPQTGILAALDSKVITVAEGATGTRTAFVRFGGLDWEARARLEALSRAGKPGA